MRANSLFAAGPEGPEKQLHELTAAELKALGDQLERDRRALLAQLEAEDGQGSVFE
jgi:putative aminopeptidase FrvX